MFMKLVPPFRTKNPNSFKAWLPECLGELYPGHLLGRHPPLPRRQSLVTQWANFESDGTSSAQTWRLNPTWVHLESKGKHLNAFIKSSEISPHFMCLWVSFRNLLRPAYALTYRVGVHFEAFDEGFSYGKPSDSRHIGINFNYLFHWRMILFLDKMVKWWY